MADQNQLQRDDLANTILDGNLGDLRKKLESGIDPAVLNGPTTKRKYDGMSLLEIALACNHPEAAKLRTSAGADPIAKDKDGRSILHRIAGDLSFNGSEFGEGGGMAVRRLVKAGADVNAKGGIYSTTALMEAASIGNVGIATALIEAGANVNARSGEKDLSDGQSALHYAATAMATGKEGDIVELLRKGGAALNAKDNIGRTPLMYAVGDVGNKASLKALIAAGADVNAKDKYGRTALMHAAESRIYDRECRQL